MPVTKKRPHIIDLVNAAVKQRSLLGQTRKEILERPASIWFRRTDDDEPKNEEDLEKFYFRFFSAKYHNKAMVISRWCEKVVHSNFDFIVRSCIWPIAFSFLAYQVPKGDSVGRSSVDMFFYTVEIIINCYFLCDSIMRFLGTYIRVEIENAFNREIGPFNIFMHCGIFDAIVTILCFVEDQTTLGLWFRFIRLLFITSAVLEMFPHIDVILGGLSSGLRSILFTITILSLLILVYASLGHHFFAANDPYNFGTYGLSVVTFFRLSTFEGWNEIYMINYLGCENYPSVYHAEGGTSEGGHGETVEALLETHFGSFEKPKCTESHGQPGLASVVFISYELFAAYVIVSMCLAVVAIGTSEKLESFKEVDVYGMNEEHDEPQSKKQSSNRGGGKPQQRSAAKSSKAAKMMGHSHEEKLLLSMLHKIWEGQEGVVAHAEAELKRIRHGDLSDASWKSIALDVEFFIMHNTYQLLACGWILADAILQIHDETVESSVDLNGLHWMFQAGFVVDVFLKILTHVDKMSDFIKDKWNIFDLVITTVLFVPVSVPSDEVLAFLGCLRILRLARILKTLSFFMDLKVILDSISSSFRSLLYVGFLVVIFYLYSAIVGVLMFRTSDPYHFGGVGVSMRTLFQIMTLDLWSDVMRINMYGCKEEGFNTGVPTFDSLCNTEGIGMGWWAPIFFCPFVVLATFVLMSTTIGVIITSLELLREEANDENSIWEKVRKVQKRYGLDTATVDMLLNLFERLDKDGDASLSFDEADPVFTASDYNEKDTFDFFMMVDKDKSGKIDFAEFCEMITLVGKARDEYKKSKPSDSHRISTMTSMTGGVRKTVSNWSLRLFFAPDAAISPTNPGVKSDGTQISTLATSQNLSDEIRPKSETKSPTRHGSGVSATPSPSCSPRPNTPRLHGDSKCELVAVSGLPLSRIDDDRRSFKSMSTMRIGEGQREMDNHDSVLGIARESAVASLDSNLGGQISVDEKVKLSQEHVHEHAPQELMRAHDNDDGNSLPMVWDSGVIETAKEITHSVDLGTQPLQNTSRNVHFSPIELSEKSYEDHHAPKQSKYLAYMYTHSAPGEAGVAEAHAAVATHTTALTTSTLSGTNSCSSHEEATSINLAGGGITGGEIHHNGDPGHRPTHGKQDKYMQHMRLSTAAALLDPHATVPVSLDDNKDRESAQKVAWT